MKLPKIIRLTAEHIDAGLANEYPDDPETCPIATALREAMPEALEVEVSRSELLEKTPRSIIRIRLDSGGEFRGTIDCRTAGWLSRWDQQVKLLLAYKPHSFKSLRDHPPIVQMERWYRESKDDPGVWYPVSTTQD